LRSTAILLVEETPAVLGTSFLATDLAFYSTLDELLSKGLGFAVELRPLTDLDSKSVILFLPRTNVPACVLRLALGGMASLLFSFGWILEELLIFGLLAVSFNFPGGGLEVEFAFVDLGSSNKAPELTLFVM
jgi:hypothetical protein